jgi:lysozyme
MLPTWMEKKVPQPLTKNELWGDGTMTTSPAGRKLIEMFEGFAPGAYLDQRGIRTIGWGHTLGVQMGDTCTQAQADAFLEADLATAEGAVSPLVSHGALNQNQYDALVSLAYNIGAHAFVAESTVFKRLNQQPPDYAGAAQAFLLWDKANGETDPGLVRRRQVEMALFLTPEV